MQFHTDFSIHEAGFLFGWTVLPLPADGIHCALDCSLSQRGDGKCDAACMNGFCEFDRGDCEDNFECSAGCTTDQIGNGVCDQSCLTARCNWDARDCECPTVLQEDAGYHSEGDARQAEQAWDPMPSALAGLSDFYAFQTSTPTNARHLCWLIRPKLPNVTSITLSLAYFDVQPWSGLLRIYDGRCALKRACALCP